MGMVREEGWKPLGGQAGHGDIDETFEGAMVALFTRMGDPPQKKASLGAGGKNFLGHRLIFR
jgi:hypothetical protein